MKQPMTDMRPTYLVTGASGFVGGGLASRLLREGEQVVCLIRDGHAPSGAVVVRGDLSSYDDCRRAVMKAGPHCRVYHLGAQAKVGYARRNRLETFESNIRGTYNLLEAVHVHAPWAPVVVASSDKAYGELTGDDRYSEDMPMEGRGFYDVSKSCTDLIARSYAYSGLDVAVVRAGNIYGPTDVDLSRVVPSFCRDLMRYMAPVIESDGTPVRDYLHVSDAVDGYQAVMQRLITDPLSIRGRAYNLAGGEPMSVLALAETMRMIWAAESRRFIDNSVVRGTRLGEISCQVLDCSRARTELGWSPKIKLADGLLRTLRWWYSERPGL